MRVSLEHLFKNKIKFRIKFYFLSICVPMLLECNSVVIRIEIEQGFRLSFS
jgi:hypothetical protein